VNSTVLMNIDANLTNFLKKPMTYKLCEDLKLSR